MALASIPRLTAMHQEIDTSPEYFGELESSAELLGDAAALHERMATEGYLYMPGLAQSGRGAGGAAGDCRAARGSGSSRSESTIY